MDPYYFHQAEIKQRVIQDYEFALYKMSHTHQPFKSFGEYVDEFNSKYPGIIEKSLIDFPSNSPLK